MLLKYTSLLRYQCIEKILSDVKQLKKIILDIIVRYYNVSIFMLKI